MSASIKDRMLRRATERAVASDPAAAATLLHDLQRECRELRRQLAAEKQLSLFRDRHRPSGQT